MNKSIADLISGLEVEDLSELGIPLEPAFRKIVSMLSDFDYTSSQAQCISNYITFYSRMFQMEDTPLGDILGNIKETLLVIANDPMVAEKPLLVLGKGELDARITIPQSVEHYRISM